MREIVLDTETTGFDPYEGHRVVEIGCVELVNLLPTGRHFQVYLNPQRSMPLEAFQVHGLSDAFLADKPLFSAIAQDFLGFIGDDARLVAHNADFDMRFINWELQHAALPTLPMNRVRDTVSMARRALPGMRVTLDNLCRRFNIDLSARQKHGALLDAELLAEVYLELSGGRQNRLALANAGGQTLAPGADPSSSGSRKSRPRRHFAPSAAEKAAHQAFIDGLSNPLWRR